MMNRFKTGGRKKGTPNKITTELRETLTDFISNEFNGIQERVNSLKPKERLNLLTKLIPYVIPRAIEQMNFDDITITLREAPEPPQPTTYVIVDKDDINKQNQ
jgi:hypothetical protein